MQTAAIVYIFVAILGLAIGSFLNVLIYRLPRDRKTVLARSECPHCGQKIPLYLNIPLVSYVMLAGKCRSCKAPISIRYPLVEFLDAALYLVFLYYDGLTIQLPVHCFLASALVVIFFIDFGTATLYRTKLPSREWSSGWRCRCSPVLRGLSIPSSDSPSAAGRFWVVAYLGEWLFKKEAMGGGDIKMAAMMGAFVGWQKVLLIFLGASCPGNDYFNYMDDGLQKGPERAGNSLRSVSGGGGIGGNRLWR